MRSGTNCSINTFTDDALGNDDATALAARIRRREVSVAEVTAAAIQRAQRANPSLNGIAAAGFEQAMSLAHQVDSDTGNPAAFIGFFAGTPTFIKDNTNVKGLPTGHGSPAVPHHLAAGTSNIAKQVLAQGFICLGKSTLPEFGFNATTESSSRAPTVNPWNTAYSSGASSGGAAALVAAGVVPLAHANDGGGSIRIPAACCGLVGLKPSRGRLVDNDAAKSLPINILADGVVSRSVRDTANFMAQAEHYYRDKGLPGIGELSGPSERKLTIGLIVDSVTGHQTDKQVREAVERTARTLEKLGHSVHPVAIPVASTFPDDFALYWAMLAFGVKANGRKLIHPDFDKHRVDNLTNGLAAFFRKRFYRLPAALWRLRKSRTDYARAMAAYDAVLTPVLGQTAPPLGHLSPDVPFDTLFDRLTRYVSFTPVANATGAPAISLPAGFSNEKTPLSVQFMAPFGKERTLIDLAYTLEAESPWPHLFNSEVPSRADIADISSA
ncbi:amidase [Marinobacter salinexigens]|uniref:Amidase n=1 Tax=Marinobacter salinexigens TaxID=2919747 RepID=A0A5B0V7F2_9GAMM|nr:amidase [Marinobacter salinexigens]KAA1170586.1 amidase [Marinobacter salinexigens]